MTFKKCRNDGCDVIIEVRQTPEGWRPFLESGQMHQCQFSDYAKKQKATFGEKLEMDKDDHGNEDVGGAEIKTIPTTEFLEKTYPKEKDDHGNEDPISPKEYVERLGYVDHTTAAKGHFRAFVAKTVEELNEVANTWLEVQNIRFKQWGQLQVTNDGFAIALYYEETKQ